MQHLKDALSNFNNALISIKSASQEAINTERDLAGLIKMFELLYETCWKCLSKLLSELGSPTRSPRNTFETAFKEGLISNDSAWVRILKDRNISVHVYDKKQSEDLVNRIKNTHIQLFESCYKKAEKEVKRLK